MITENINFSGLFITQNLLIERWISDVDVLYSQIFMTQT